MQCNINILLLLQVRQYFRDEEFFAHDIQTRSLCHRDAPRLFQCGSFSPSAVTVKVKWVMTDLVFIGAYVSLIGVVWSH